MPEIRIPNLCRDQADGQIGGAEQALCLLHFLLNDIILQVHAGLFLKKPGHVIRIQVDSLGQFFPAQLIFQMLGNVSHNDLHGTLTIFFRFAVPDRGHIMDQLLHIRHGLHAVAVKFQRFRLPEHIVLPFLFRQGEEHLHKILIKIPQGLAVQLIVGRQLIQQLAGFLLHCLRTSRLQQLKDPTKGFAPDFTTRILKEAGKEAWDKHIKICTNAGGMNINGCVDGIRQWAEGNSMSGYKIGYVTGDNIKDKIPQLLKDGWTFPNFDYDGNFNDILDKIYNCNVYIGHEGIEGCLAEGADVVITGRAADSALFLAPLKYEFGWAADDWDNLARGIMAGHLLECGGQGAGGNYMYDWRNVPRMDELGFPIAELTDDTFEITKAPDCGGIICEQSCKEQFLYEVHDPANYLTPDVNVDISHATITQVGDNRVRIGGVKGKPRPDTLKLCVGYHKGWKTVSMLSFAWPDAYEKAQYCAEVIMKKMQRRGMKADDIHISYIGLNSLHLGVADMSEEALKNLNECVLRIAVFSEDKSECAKIIPEISPLQLNGPPGASFFGGRARVQEVMALWPTTVPRDAVQVESHILEVK